MGDDLVKRLLANDLEECDEAADRIEELEAKLAKVISAYRMEALRRRDYTHDAFDRHIAELTGDEDE